MGRIRNITIEGYKSIQNPVTINFPENQPVVIIGENNCGKSNIIKAIDILFGEWWPGSRSMDDHDHWNRNSANKIIIEAEVSGIKGNVYDRGVRQYVTPSGFYWAYEKSLKQPEFSAISGSTGEKCNVNGEVNSETTAIIVDADRNLSYQLSYASKWTLLSKVMKKFHSELVSDDARVEKLKTLFSSIKDTFYEVNEFKSFADEMSSIAGEMLFNMTYGLDLDFSAYDPSNFFQSLKISPSENGVPRSFSELGTGQQQVLALSFAHAYSKAFFDEDILLIIEEPEAHLHPLAQKWLAKTIHKMAVDGLQVIITTHSPHFVNLQYFEGICLIRKDDDGTYLINKTAADLFQKCTDTGGRGTLETVVPFYANHAIPHILNGFFAKKIILVEGLTEELALPEYFLKLGLDTNKEGIEIIGVQGKGNLAKWWRLFTLFEIPTYVCFDNDGSGDGNGNKRKDALRAIGIPEENLDGILGNNDWNINNDFCVFGQDFEVSLRNSIANYSDLETSKRDELGSYSKHIIAKEVAKTLEITDEEGWEKLKEIKEKIENK